MSTGTERTLTTDPSDLLGDPLPATPAMNAPLPWRVFWLTDCEWWVARTLAEAIEDYTRVTGAPVEEDAHELTDDEMDRLYFIDQDEHERPIKSSRRPFRVELAQRVAAGLSKPELFARTEY